MSQSAMGPPLPPDEAQPDPAKLYCLLTRAEREMLVTVLRYLRADGWRTCGNYDQPFWSKKGAYRVFLHWYEGGVAQVRIDDRAARQALADYWPRTIHEGLGVAAAFGLIPRELIA